MDVETTQTETTTENIETPETNVEETVETPEVETVETKEETTVPVEETKNETVETTEPEEKEETPEDITADEKETTDNDELSKLESKYKAEAKKVESLKNQVKDLEAVVKGILDAKVAGIPKEYKSLIPEGSLTKQLDWINKAEASGLFKKSEPKDVEIGKPLNLGRKNEKANSNQTAQEKLSNYFSDFYSKK